MVATHLEPCMSESATKAPPESDSLGGFEVETPAGTASVEVIGTPTNTARVDIRIDSGRHWVFGVNDDTAALVLVLNQDGQRVDDDLPSWIEPIIQRTGLEGVEK
ncbi:hypothetical protein C485_07572 [Natrinema altunense JCM 12890]|uniref:Uncharacterized protein n=1 Tax=Natrinema altunense (strain JCM 12890 / CGMCC 1.3731 / AJ2) TaxID=1227494 RepID=L9ZK77_NATA2|nr:hypothetical protein C485_07572 [Natrinema altunense JCM 12890]